MAAHTARALTLVPPHALLKATLVWFAILVLAILNGVLRDVVVVDLIGETMARLVSGIVLCAAILAAAILTAPWLGNLSPRSRWFIGATWLALTLVFEISVEYAQHQSWQRILDAYTLQGGDLWPLVLATTFLAPWAGARVRGIA